MLPLAFALQIGLGIFFLRQIVLAIRRWLNTTQLTGPPSQSIVFGIMRKLANAPDAAVVYEAWANTYGQVYQIPGALGTTRIVLCDPKAISHVYSLDTWKYDHTPTATRHLLNLMGPSGLLTIKGESHKRQRKILNSAFGPQAIRSYTPIFLDAAYRVKTAWEAVIQSTSDDTLIDVADWMDRVSLDVIGLAGFSHDFGSLLGHKSTVAETFAALGHFKPSQVTKMVMHLSQVFPSLLKLPMPRNALVAKLSDSMAAITNGLLVKARLDGSPEKSAIGLLLKAENAELSEAEVRVHLKTLLFAGNETTSASLKWGFLELSMNPDKQDKLREELASLSTADPTYEDLVNGLPYLDAVVREVMRLHPPVDSLRVALQDDVIPLAYPIKTASGEIIERLTVSKGTCVSVPIRCLNRASHIWGEDAKTFVPERWLLKDGLPQRAKEFTGYHHMLTFLEGPRTCLGKGFALAEMKTVLAVLVRSYKFLPRDGPDTEYDVARRVVPHPRIAKEGGSRLPMRVRRVE